ncbi:hypothetical protein VPH35_061986 [Triticum aestivum]
MFGVPAGISHKREGTPRCGPAQLILNRAKRPVAVVWRFGLSVTLLELPFMFLAPSWFCGRTCVVKVKPGPFKNLNPWNIWHGMCLFAVICWEPIYAVMSLSEL